MLTKSQSESLLRFVWSSGALCNKKLVSTLGHSIEVKSVGLASNIDGVPYKKIPAATGGVLSGGILGRIQLANAIES
jgi:hypothetical protein